MVGSIDFRRVIAIFRSKEKNKLSNIFLLTRKNYFYVGLSFHLFGWIMPYIYLYYVADSIMIKVIVTLITLGILGYIKFKYLNKRNHQTEITTAEIKSTSTFMPELVEGGWSLYDKSFQKINRLSPCKQSFDKAHFLHLLSSNDVIKVWAEEYG